MKKRCQEIVWPEEEEEGASYYVADGSGISIERENIEIMSEDGKNIIAWTLANYLEVSHIKYPSRTRLYCVKVSIGTIMY